MFKSFFIFIAVLYCCNFANAQDVFSPSDPIVTYNSSATAGSATNPYIPINGIMKKWVRTKRVTSFNTDLYKCYIWNGMAFRLRFPNGYNPASSTKYPLIVFYHGGGEVGTVYDDDLQMTWGADSFQARTNRGEWNGFQLFPQQTSIGWNDYYYSRVNSVLDTLLKYDNLDPDRVIAMGLSAGGYGALDYAAEYPKRVAVSLPASPYQPNLLNSTVNTFAQIPIYFANGGVDANPDPYSMSSFCSTFRNAGGNIYQTFIAPSGHNTWTAMWSMKNTAGNFIINTYWNAAHKAQPVVYYQNQDFCASGPISATMGITAGFSAYEWQQNGITIPGATGNEYTATQVGQYRVRFMRDAGGTWSDWSPNPIVISTKTCAIDTLFAEHFDSDNPYSSSAAYSNGNFTCQGGIMTTGTDLFTKDASGAQGDRFLANFTSAPSGKGCTYTAGAEVWGAPNLITVLPAKDYEFTFYVGNQSTTSRALLIPTINGIALTAIAAQTTGTGNASWKKFTYTWNSGTATTADLSIINNNAATTGNDFMIDEISFKVAGTLRTLPVTWLSVSAKLVSKEVQVLWKVANEVNVSNYIVQRSTDGISFTDIAVINANAATSIEKQYSAIDRLPQMGINYYRIRQVDNDGKFTYSQTVLVNVTETGAMIVWPNPATTTLNIQNGQAMQRLQCFNSSGQLLYDVKPAATQYAIPVQQWPAGVYYIQITGNNQVQQTRFVKK